MLGDVSLADLYYERFGVYPEGDYQYYDPTYGQNQAPPPPEEVPQAQAPRPEIGPAIEKFQAFLSEEEQGPRDFDKWYTMLNPKFLANRAISTMRF